MRQSVLCCSIGMLLLPAAYVNAQDEASAENGVTAQERKVEIGLSIAPVRLNLRNKNRTLVGLGSYYVNAQSGCADCHSCPTFRPGHNPFPPPVGTNGDGQLNAANYLAGGVPFELGPTDTVHSANITPDSSGKPAGLTFEEFLKLIRTGAEPEDPDERLTIMPWPFYRHMVQADLRAIYEYLSAVPHAEPGSCVAPQQ